MTGPAASVDDVLALYERWGADPYDEEVAQLAHALQTAALAEAAGAADPVVAAALLHDVGHLLVLRDRAAGGACTTAVTTTDSTAVNTTDTTTEPPAPHERTGPAYLARLFPPSVTAPIALHVAAKRYLCAVDPTYGGRLSAGSQRSLRRQGGPMTAAEARAFEATPGCEGAVALRRWDDAGKIDGASVPTLAAYEPMLRSLACSAS